MLYASIQFKRADDSSLKKLLLTEAIEATAEDK